MRDRDLIEWLMVSLNPDDNARARWLLYLHAEQEKVLKKHRGPRSKKNRKKRAA
jgi:hypothetical protein